MKVRELIEFLQECDPDLPVVLSRDAEGNGYEELRNVDVASWDGESVGILELTPELEAQGYSEADVHDTPCVGMWP